MSKGRRKTTSESVPARDPRQKHLTWPLTGEEVDEGIAAADRSTPGGRRDFALLLILARLGLRASDVLARRQRGEFIPRGKRGAEDADGLAETCRSSARVAELGEPATASVPVRC